MLTDNDSSASRLVRVVPAVHRLLRSLVAEAKPAGGLAGYRALVLLVEGGPSPLKDLAARDGVEPPTMSRTVDALVRHGLVDRRSGEDRRTLSLSATPAGRNLVAQVRADLALKLEPRVAGWTTEQQNLVSQALDLIQRSLL